MKRFWKVLFTLILISSIGKAQPIEQVISFKLEASNSEAGLTICWEELKEIDAVAYRLEKLDEEWNYKLVEQVVGGVFKILDSEAVDGENIYRLVAELSTGELISSELFIADYFKVAESAEFNTIVSNTIQSDSLLKSKLFTFDYINPMMVLTRLKLTTQSLFTDNLITINNVKSPKDRDR